MPEYPLVSIIIPVYNGAATICRALDSVFAQTYQNIEVIVVDDGSIDDTRQQLKPFMDRIHYIWQENRERSAARNRGIERASGRYVAFLDADDWWSPLKLAYQVAVMESRPEIGLLSTGRIMVPAYGSVPKTMQTAVAQDLQPQLIPFEKLVLRNHVGSPSQVMVRAEVLEEVGLFDTALRQGEDWDLWLRIAGKYPIAMIPAPLTYYQLSASGELTRLANRNARIAYRYIMDKLFASSDIEVRYKALEHPARARILLQSALISCAFSKVDEASRDLCQAIKYDPSLFQPANDELSMWVIGFAHQVKVHEGQLTAGIRYIDRLWSLLPVSVARKMGSERRRLKGLFCAGNFFSAYEAAHWEMVFKSAWRAVLWQPGWLTNRGFLSIWAQAWLWKFKRASAPSTDI